MAEIQTIAATGKKRNTKSKKLSTRVDLTPMVDLGFLLITFFIFTTTLSEQKTMKLNLPKDDSEHGIQVPESKTLSLLLCNDNKVKYYTGNNIRAMGETDYSPTGIRNVILQHEQEIAARYGTRRSETIVLIKPTNDCTYQNVVNTLDEMTINGVQRYILMDINKEELNFIK